MEQPVQITDGKPPDVVPQATIFFRDSNTPKVVRFKRWYHKGDCLNVELAGVKDDQGFPVILEIPHLQYTYALRPHLPHLGMEDR